MKVVTRNHLLALLILVCSGTSSPCRSISTDVRVNGTWNGNFSGLVEGTGTSQTDTFVMELERACEKTIIRSHIWTVALVFAVIVWLLSSSFNAYGQQRLCLKSLTSRLDRVSTTCGSGWVRRRRARFPRFCEADPLPTRYRRWY